MVETGFQATNLHGFVVEDTTLTRGKNVLAREILKKDRFILKDRIPKYHGKGFRLPIAWWMGPCAPFWSVHKISYEVAVENGVIGAVVTDILLLGNDMQFEHILRLASKDRFKDKCNMKMSKVITSLSTFWTWLERAVTEARPSSTSWQISSCFLRTSQWFMRSLGIWTKWDYEGLEGRSLWLKPVAQKKKH